MDKFLELEGGYLAIGVFIMCIAAVVTTRSFVGKNAFKTGMPITFLFLAFFIGLHFYVTTNRMDRVKTRFTDGKPVICENRINRKAEQSIIISNKEGWSLEGDIFKSPKFTRPFHTARCLRFYNKEFPEPKE